MSQAGKTQGEEPGEREAGSGGSPPSELRSFADPVSDSQVLAAVERAETHRAPSEPGVLPREVVHHMGFAYNPAAMRKFRPYIDALIAAGLLGIASRKKVDLWVLTSTGRRALVEAQGKGEVAVLPESPQHRKWRHSREAASERIESYRDELRALLGEAHALLDTGVQAHSDLWFDLATRLTAPATCIGAAIYCLMEWPEPDDARPDVDGYSHPDDHNLSPEERGHRRLLRRGRRNIIRGEIV
jgi:hypothetical protein